MSKTTDDSFPSNKSEKKIEPYSLYELLFEKYGPQGWWPLLELQGNNSNPTMRGRCTGYHPNDYSYPNTENQRFEIILGTILTQNTTWTNAEKAIYNLQEASVLSLESLEKLEKEKIAELIRPSGYYNQKSIKIMNMVEFLKKNPIQSILKKTKSKKDILLLREKLLEIKGVGPETADSIILYAFNLPKFVVDTYTKRIFARMSIVPSEPSPDYHFIQKIVETNFSEKLDLKDIVSAFNEFHALLVQHAVHVCKKKPLCQSCFLTKSCPKIEFPKLKPKKKKRSGVKTKSIVKSKVSNKVKAKAKALKNTKRNTKTKSKKSKLDIS